MKRLLNITIFCYLLLIGLPVWAATPLLSLKLTTLSSLWEDNQDDIHFPLSQYLYLYSDIPQLTSEVAADFRYAKDLAGGKDRFDLYRGTVTISALKKYLDIELGRMQIAEGIDYFILDGARFSGEIDKLIDWSVYGGYTGDTELGKDRDSGKLAGLRVSLLNYLKIRNQLSFLIEDYKNGANDQRVSFSLGHNFSAPQDLALDGGIEYSIEAKSIAKLYAVNDYYFTQAVSFNLSYYYHDPLSFKELERDQIYASFASSGVHLIRPAFNFMIKDIVDIEPSYAMSSYKATDDERKFSHRLGLAFYLMRNRLQLKAKAAYRYWKNYGGNNHLLDFTASRHLGKKIDLRLGGEIAFYEKITNESARASTIYLESGILLTRQAKLSISGEVMSNEDKKYDTRLNLQLQIGLENIL